MKQSKKRIVHLQNGFTLIEGLVALLVLSIGMLGLAALQSSGIRFNHDAYMRTQATTLAYDVIENLRIDRDNAILNSAYPGEYEAAESSVNCSFNSASAANAIICWQTEIRDNLIGGVVVIGPPTNPPGRTSNNQFTISITWQNKWQEEGKESDFTTSFQNWTVEI